MRKILLGFICATSIGFVFASDEASCNAVGGTLVSGTVSKAPYYKPGSFLKGVELSHTHVSLISDQDGQNYDVAMDNVFASGYDQASNSVPYPLNTIKLNDHLELCGALYTSGTGIHWVHTNCGEAPTASKPSGWLKEIYADASVSNNFEDSREYCSLWN